MKKKYLTKCIRVNHETEEVPKLIFSGTKTETFDNYVSIDELEKTIEDICNKFDRLGYDVISIVPIIRGSWDSECVSDGGAGWGYSVTDGVAVTAKRE